GGRPPLGHPVRPLNRLYLAGVLHAGAGWDDLDRIRGGNRDPQKFKPSLDEEGVWRTLAVRVTRDEVVAYWGGEKDPACRTAAKKIHEDMGLFGRGLVPAHRAHGIPYRYAHRGAVGLFVQAGVASFRNARLLPLTP
ncbi:MAG: hypothetical protein ACRC33_12480, partial [Gemmataceae bacterium]